MRRACAGDLRKALLSGKSVVLEGVHVDPGMYMWEFGLLDAIDTASRSNTSRGPGSQELDGGKSTTSSCSPTSIPGALVTLKHVRHSIYIPPGICHVKLLQWGRHVFLQTYSLSRQDVFRYGELCIDCIENA